MDLAYIVNQNPLNVDLSGDFLTGAEPFYKTIDGVANTDTSILLPARLVKTHYLTYIHIILSGAVAANNCVITVKDGDSIRYKTLIPSTAPIGSDKTVSFVYPIAITTGSALEVKATAAGAGAILTVNVGGYTL